MFNTRLYYFAFIFIFIFGLSCAQASPQCAIEKFGQYQLEYCLYNNKGPLLILEGAQGNGMNVWPKSFIFELNKFAQVLTYNRIGYGQSHYYQQKLSSPITAKITAEQLHDLLQRLKINGSIILVGHSIGGLYAQYFLRNYPENIAALVLLDADSSFEPKTNSPFQSKIPDEKGSAGYFESLGFSQSMDEVNHSPALPNIPLLVITATNHGGSKKTEALWQLLQRKIVEQSPQGRQIIAEGSGHFVFQDAPNLIIKAMRHLISSNQIK